MPGTLWQPWCCGAVFCRLHLVLILRRACATGRPGRSSVVIMVALAAADPGRCCQTASGSWCPLSATPTAGGLRPPSDTGRCRSGGCRQCTNVSTDTLRRGKDRPLRRRAARRQSIERLARSADPCPGHPPGLGFAATPGSDRGHRPPELLRDKYQSGDYGGRYSLAHEGLGISTSICLAPPVFWRCLPPNPYPKPIRLWIPRSSIRSR